MLHRIATHMLEIEYDRPQANKYKVLHSALESGYRIKFDVLYYSTCLLEEEIIEDIGAEEGKQIREHRPPLNYQIPKADNWRRYTVNKAASKIKLEDIAV